MHHQSSALEIAVSSLIVRTLVVPEWNRAGYTSPKRKYRLYAHVIDIQIRIAADLIAKLLLQKVSAPVLPLRVLV